MGPQTGTSAARPDDVAFLRNLEASQERLELALRAADLGLWDWDTRTDEVHFSDRYATMLGYEPGELAGCYDTFLSLPHPEDVPHAPGNVEEVFRGLQPGYRNCLRMRTKDGQYRWIESRGWRAFDSQGQPARMLGTHRDITREREAQEEMRRANFSSRPRNASRVDIESGR